MKKILFISKTVLSIALIVTVVSVAHAWTAPTTNPTGGNVPAPVNTGSVAQTKNSDLGLVGNLMAFRGFFSQYVNAPKARFGCLLFSCGSTSFTSSNIFEAGAYDNGVAFDKGLIVHADGGVQITSGNPGAGKVLTSDATGNASWGNGSTDTIDSGGLISYVRRYQPPTGTDTVIAYCQPGSIAIGGGGDCQYGIKISQPYVAGLPNNVHGDTFSGATPAATGWRVSCLSRDNPSTAIRDGGNNSKLGDARAEVVCMKKDAMLALGSNVGNGNGVSGGTTGGTWHYAGTPSSPSASSCGAAYGVSNQDVATLTIPATSPNYSYTLPNDPNSLPANQGMTIQQAQCSTTGSTNYVSGAATLPAGATWANQSTGPAFSTGNGTFGKFFYYTLKRY